MTTRSADQFVEDMATIYEALGLPRMAARTWAHLWITDQPHLSAAELGELLQASAGSVSAAIRFLMDLGLIDRVRIPGERRAYYQASTTALERLLLRRTAGTREMIRLTDRGIAEFGDAPLTRQRLEEMRSFYAWFLEEMEDMVLRWQEASTVRAEERRT